MKCTTIVGPRSIRSALPPRSVEFVAPTSAGANPASFRKRVTLVRRGARPLVECIAIRYAYRMTQLVTRIDPDLVDSVDELIAEGVVESRSDAVRQGLRALIEQTRRRRIAEAIVAGYVHHPQADDEVAWADEATAQMIADEPW